MYMFRMFSASVQHLNDMVKLSIDILFIFIALAGHFPVGVVSLIEFDYVDRRLG